MARRTSRKRKTSRRRRRWYAVFIETAKGRTIGDCEVFASSPTAARMDPMVLEKLDRVSARNWRKGVRTRVERI